MPLSVHQNLSYPGPTAGVTLLGSALNLSVYQDVTPTAIPSNQRVAILSIVTGHSGADVQGASCTFSDEDENILFVVSAGSESSNEHGFMYPPLLPAGKKLIVKSGSTSETTLVIYVQYMLVPVN
jgi:hypothetical protein